MTEVVTLGECLIAFVATRPGPLAEAITFERFVAGAEANVAVGLARLGHDTTYIGRVGSDGFADTIRWRLRGEGVDTTYLGADPDAPTGLMFRERRGLGPAQVVYVRRGSAGSRIAADDVDRAAEAGVFRDARWLHVTGITPALSPEARAATERAVVLARDGGLTISLDLNLRRRIWSDEAAAPVLRALAGRVDVLLGSHDELAVVTGQSMTDSPADLARAALTLGPATAIVKMAADGALAVERADPAVAHVRPAVPLPQLVDPVGAGDAFCAGYIAATLEGATLDDALGVANACGAASAAELGDQTGLPDRDRLAAILASGIGDPGHDTIR